MQQGKPSQTAIASAFFRAAHQILDGEPKILDDPLSVGLVPGSSREEIAAQAARLNADGMKQFRINFVLRNRFAEDALRDAVQAGVTQCVLLGAGLDTFAYRRLGWARQLKIFEVDHPAAQAWKQDLLRNSSLQLPENLFLVPCDFETTTLREALASASIDDKRPAFFSWLGVTQYLTREAIDATLRYVSSLPRGTRIVITQPVPLDTLSGPIRDAMENAASAAARFGEPWITLLRPDEWDRWLTQLGFTRVFHLTTGEAFTRYFAERNDGLEAGGNNMILAEV